jgi:hypothetical protein
MRNEFGRHPYLPLPVSSFLRILKIMPGVTGVNQGIEDLLDLLFPGS